MLAKHRPSTRQVGFHRPSMHHLNRRDVGGRAEFCLRPGVLMLAPSSDPTVASVFAPRAAIDPDGTVEGYASVFGEIDHARHMVMHGALAQSLATRGVRRVPMLFQHDPSEPVGIWLELLDDHRGALARDRLIPQ